MASEIEEDQEGLYGVCLFGAEHLKDDEVMEICGKYGAVIRCNRNKSLVFIRYATREEAIACLKTPDQLPFRVRPATRKKDRDSMDNSRDSSWKNNNDGEFHKRRSDGDFHHRGGGNNDGEFHKRRSDGDSHYRGGGSGDSYDARRPMPALVPVIPTTASETLRPTYQVLIGNLPHITNQCDVYDLCQRSKANPVHVEMKTMNYPPNPPIRYAEVYVKTEKDVTNIVEALNNLAISDHQLVVWRPQ